MQRPYKALLLSLVAAVLLVPLNASGQSRVGEVSRIVEGRSQNVSSTTRAEIDRQPEPVRPVEKGENLLVRDALGLQEQLWMELNINRGDLQGHVILAEAGFYSVDSLNPDNALRFRLRQGRMSVNLKRGELGVFLKDRLISILGTEVFLQVNEATNQVYLKRGTIVFKRPGEDSLYVEGKEMAWRWQDGQTPERITGQAMRRWKEQMKYDTRTVWRKPFFKRTWVRLGMAALVGGAVYYYLQRDDGPRNAQGTIIIDIPD